MKICIINSLYSPYRVGGAEKSVQYLAEELVNCRKEVVVISTSPKKGVYSDVLNGVRVFYVSLKNLYWPYNDSKNRAWLKPLWHTFDSYNPIMARKVSQILDVERPDLVHTNNLAGFSVAVWRYIKQRGLPVVHTLRDYYLLCPKSTMFKHSKNCKYQCAECRLFSYSRKRATSLVDGVMGISRFILDRHMDFGCFSNSIVQKVIFNASGAEGSACVQNRDDGRPVKFGYLGRLHPTKGVELVLQAFQELQVQGWEFWLAGTGTDEYTKLLKQRYVSQNVHFMGFTGPQELFSKIDVLIVPSLWHEPLGRTVLESYAHAVPVIGSNRGGISEVIEEGETGFLFEPDRTESLKSAISRFIADPELAGRMRPDVLKKSQEFMPERIMAEYLDIYEMVL